MDILLLGGTGFLGRHIARIALERGHRVTCLARGTGEPPAGVDFVAADRDRDDAYDKVASRSWGTVVDLTSHPRHARDAVATLDAEHRVFVSSSSVYEHQGNVSAESDPVVAPLDADCMESMEQYPAAKSACEAAYRVAEGPVLIVRPGLIAGYGDETARSGYYPWRFAHPTGDDVIVPDPTFPIAMIDAEDLAGWIVRSAEDARQGAFNATGHATTLAEVFAISRELTGSQATARPLADEQLLACGVNPWMGPKSLPLWVPGEPWRNVALLDCAAAYEAGLQVRPLRETLASALRYEGEREGARLAGLRDEEEAELRECVAAGD
ncbi:MULTISPECIES: NAD-dependent epimerase/dehydratase family protein [unclassified Luteococcus]|uniref:NAD-dependent epimerase/dehydratase family protein n=1 Tax=unclassified Luteococcus TaxID=2639923 RepID=UPI00313CAFA9